MAKLFVEPITRSVGEWHLPLGGGASFFKGLTEATLSFLKSPAEGFKSFLEPIMSSDSLKNLDPGQIAYHLIYQSLKHAVYKLLDDNKRALGPYRQDSEPIADSLDSHLQHIRLTIDDNFFHSTHQLSFWNGVRDLFSQWLVEVFALPGDTARALSNRLSLYFEIALDEEWSRYPDDYKILKDKLLTPLTPLAIRAKGWLSYLQRLEEEINRPILGEEFGLEKIYIPLRSYYEIEKPNPENEHHQRQYHKEEKKYFRVEYIEKCLNDWIALDDPKDALRIITGEPGSGKSSCARMFAVRQAALGDRMVLFVPLHDFDATADFEEALQNFVSRKRTFDGYPIPFRFREDRLLIIFDALDEIELRGKAWEDISRQFIDMVEKTLSDWNRDKSCLHVLITGRILSVQEHQHRFNRKVRGATLNIMSYYEPYDIFLKANFKDPDHLISIDQRNDWWRQYGQICGRNFPDLPLELKNKKLDELTSRPLLNHLVAQIYRDGKLDLSEEFNINTIYHQMILCIYERGWEFGRPHDVTKDMHFDHFIHTLEEIAVGAWHGDGRRVTASAIETRLHRALPLKEILEGFKQREGSKAVSRLLTGFYFEEGVERFQGDRTFEFTHKSFGEYLFARGLVRLLSYIYCNLQEHLRDYQRGWDERRCLDFWAELCGPTAIDLDLFFFLEKEMLLAFKNKSPVGEWQQTLAALIGFMLRQGMFGDKLPKLSFLELSRQSHNAELALLAALNACASVTKFTPRIEWPSPTAFGAWMAALVGQRSGQDQMLSLNCLNFLDLSNCILYGRDWARSVLVRSNLSGANLENINLREANLHGVILRHANLNGADLHSADLRQVKLNWASLQEADLSQADLSEAELRWASLTEANMQEANLSSAILESVDLNHADLRKANLRKASLKGTHLLFSDLREADLRGADLSGVYVHEETQVAGVKIDATTRIEEPSNLANLLQKSGILPI
jgi:uncharacterized protein YjbI with pentapeptide repeats